MREADEVSRDCKAPVFYQLVNEGHLRDSGYDDEWDKK